MDLAGPRVLVNPSLLASCNAYRRRHGNWPERATFTPVHFADMISSSTPVAIYQLAERLDLLVTRNEPSPRVTVSGRHGELSYADGVTDEDWEERAFREWLSLESEDADTTRGR